MRRDEISNNARQVRVAGDEPFRVLCCDYDRERTLALCLARPRRGRAQPDGLAPRQGDALAAKLFKRLRAAA